MEALNGCRVPEGAGGFMRQTRRKTTVFSFPWIRLFLGMIRYRTDLWNDPRDASTLNNPLQD